MSANPEDIFLTRRELANRYRRAVKTLANWASKGTGPLYILFGGVALYRLSDVLAWEDGVASAAQLTASPNSAHHSVVDHDGR